MKKLLAILAASLTLFAATAENADWLPEFEGETACVFDSERIGSKFTAITVTDYAEDRKIDAEIYGWGNSSSNEWTKVGTASLFGFGDSERLPFMEGAKVDYTRYRYFAVKVPQPATRSYKFTADLKDKSLNFYIWESYTDSNAAPLPIFKNNGRAYVFNSSTISKDEPGKARVINNTDDKIYVIIYVYNQKKHTWLTYGQADLTKKGEEKKVKKLGGVSLKESPYIAIEENYNDKDFDYNIAVSKGEYIITVK